MDEQQDPIHNFFPASEAEKENILYTTLELESTATAEEVRKAYRKLALRHHPDKHASKSDEEKEEAGRVFQRIGFAYAVLSDEGKRKRYDSTGRTDESSFADAEEMGWDAYFETLFERIDRKVLDEDKAKYQNSAEEQENLIEAYTSTSGSLPKILSQIPHSTHSDESRFIKLINDLISSGELKEEKQWKKSSTNVTASQKRGKQAVKEAKEAEAAAKELGVWDEFYGSGSKGERKGDKTKKGKGRGKGEDGGEDALAALILKRQRTRESGLSALEEKYRKIEEENKAKRAKKGRKSNEENEGPPDISDADFEALQAKMFGDKDKGNSKGKGKKSKA